MHRLQAGVHDLAEFGQWGQNYRQMMEDEPAEPVTEVIQACQLCAMARVCVLVCACVCVCLFVCLRVHVYYIHT